MATQKGVWNLQQVRDKQLQDLWTSKNGTLWFTGRAEQGRGSTSAVVDSRHSSPVQITGDWTKLYNIGNNVDCFSLAAAKGTGTLYTWGQNEYGQLADNSQTQRSSPVQVPGTTWSILGSGKKFKVATKTDGTLWAWGLNEYGQLGQGTTQHKSSPCQVPGTTWGTATGKLSAGEYNAAFIKTDGTLWTLGRGNYGQLGQNSTADVASPVQVPGTNWSQVAGDSTFRVAAIKTDGTLWGWGYNIVGSLGQNNTTHYSSPVQIFGTQTNWAQVAVGNYNVGAINTDGELWVSGNNTQGVLGQNSEGAPTRRSSPVQIPGTTWSQDPGALKLGSSFAGCLKTDNTLWWWGNNGVGQIGQNSVNTAYSSPVQLGGGMDWSGNKYDSFTIVDSGNFVLTLIAP